VIGASRQEETMKWNAARSVLVLGLATALVGLTVALGGNTAPMCQPVQPDAPVCLTALDCDGLIHPECVGAWSCVDAACVWECNVLPPKGCYSDMDCPAGTHCNAGEVCLPPPDCPMCTVCWGECVPDQPVGDCLSDADCKPGYYCKPLYKCGDPTTDPNATDKCIGSEGVCTPICDSTQPEVCGDGMDNDCDGLVDEDCGQFGCISDGDCAWYEYCDFGLYADPATGLACCPPNAKCTEDVPPCGLGTCRLQPGYCWSDADCAWGEVCEGVISPCPDGAYCLIAAPQPGKCAPGQPACSPEVCGDGLDNNCNGYVDETCYPECQADTDCGPDALCTWMSWCPDCVYQGCKVACLEKGFCMPAPQYGCKSDADCAWYEYCDFYGYYGYTDAAAEPMPPMNCCPPNALCDASIPICGEGRCVLQPGYCWYDTDCAWGETCEGEIICPPGAYCFVADQPGKCTPAACTPTTELCADGLDNDCDGMVDEGCGPACSSDADCKAGYACTEQVVCPDCYYGDPACLMPCYVQYYCVEQPFQPACHATGCSGQVCAAEDVYTTCEWLPWYDCFRKYGVCTVLADGTCGWEQSDAFLACMKDMGAWGAR
jgi:eight-cysteine-cluster-containing protein